MVTIKNIAASPDPAPNDGSAQVTVRGTIFTAADHASMARVWLDLRHTMLFEELDLTPDPGNTLIPSKEGDYTVEFPIPRLFDTGRYRLPLLALDSKGGIGRAQGHVEITYRRPDQVPEISSSEFLSGLEQFGRSRFVPDNRVEFLDSGQEAFERRLEMIERADHQINLQTYTLSHEPGSDRVVDALLAKVWKGIEVNIILNSDSQIPTSPINTLKLKLNEALSKWVKTTRLELASSEPLYESVLKRLLDRTGTQSVNLRLFRMTEKSRDRRAGMADEKQAAHWLERMLKEPRPEESRLSIPAGRLASFAGPGGLPALPLLNYAAHEKIFTVDGSSAIVGGRNIEDQYFTRWVDLDLYIEGPVVDEIQKAFYRTFDEITATGDTASSPMRILHGQPAESGTRVMFVQSRPWAPEYCTLETLVYAIQAATRRVYLSTQYLTLPESLLRDALVEAAGRGVDIRVLTNSELTCQEVNFSTGYFISLNYLNMLVAAGIRVFALNGNPDSSAQAYYHVKEFLFDGELAAVGSFNLSMRSCYIESENLLYIQDRDICAEREAAFLGRVSENATEITPAFLAKVKKEHKTRIEVSKYLELLY